MTTTHVAGYRLSPQQARLFHLTRSQDSQPFRIQGLARIEGTLDTALLERALSDVAMRHEILRTTIQTLAGLTVPVQVVEDTAQVELTVHGADRLDEVRTERQRTPFDLAQGSRLIADLFTDGEVNWLLLTIPAWNQDGAIKFLFQALFTSYEALQQGSPYTEPDEDDIQYSAVAEWWSQLLDDEDGEAGRAFWAKQNIAESLAVQWPFLQQEKAPVYAPASVRTRIEQDLQKRLEGLATEQEVSLQNVFLAAWQLLLSRLSGQNELVIGVSYDGRTDEAITESVGLLARYLPAQVDLESVKTFADLVRQAETASTNLSEWQECFVWDNVRGVESNQRMFAAGFEFEDLADALHLGGLTLNIEDRYACFDQFAIKLAVVARPDGLQLELQYDENQFTEADLHRLLGYFQTLLHSIVDAPTATLASLNLLPSDLREELLTAYNQTEQAFDLTTPLHRLFEAQASRTPDHVAVVFEGESMTYSQLDAHSNRLARYLQNSGVEPGHFIGVCMDRSVELVVSLLAVLKAGAAYITLDPSYPSDRIAYMIEDSQAFALLTREGVALPEVVSRVLLLEDATEQIASEAGEALDVEVRPEHPAYVIYTSGSTGLPKGVVVPHRAIVNHMRWMLQEFPLTTDDAVLQKTSFSFDASVWEFYAPLLSGARLVMARPGGHADPAYLIDTIHEQGITTLQAVPTLLLMMLEEPAFADCTSLKRVFCGGEALSVELRDRFMTSHRAALINLYGPTEACIDATFWTCDPTADGNLVPIGRPIANATLYILDENVQPVPPGVAGELYIGGAGLALGYLNRPELTEEKFLLHSFEGQAPTTIYRTGDLVRYGQDGVVEYLGRIDHQVKIRGYRIELGEIESLLLQHPAIKQTVVLAREDRPGDKRVVAYLVVEQESKDLEAELRANLQAKLPDYMMPSAFVQLLDLPLTPNGKIDRKALPAPMQEEALEAQFLPRTATEQELADIWCEVLGRDSVSVQSNFFDIGGHSLLATQAVSRMRAAFGYEFSLRTIFEYSTIERLAEQVEEKSGGTASVAKALIPRLPQKGVYELSHAQQQLWFRCQFTEEARLGSLSAIRMHGNLDLHAIELAFEKLVERHSILRTTIDERDGTPYQVVHERMEPPFELRDLSSVTRTDQDGVLSAHLIAEQNKPFDLEGAPFFRVTLFVLAASEYVLVINAHHMGYDGWSTGIFLRDLGALYEAALNGKDAQITPALQYAEFSNWQNQRLHNGDLDDQKQYWLTALAEQLEPSKLPTDFAEVPQEHDPFDVRSHTIGEKLTGQLRSLSNAQVGTLYVTMLAGLNLWMHLHSGDSQITIGSTLSGRTNPELESVMGILINPVAMRTALSGNPTVADILERVKKTAFDAYENQEYPFDLVVQNLRSQYGAEPNLYTVILIGTTPMAGEAGLPGVSFEPYPVDNILKGQQKAADEAGLDDSKVRFDLYIMMTDDGDRIILNTQYNSKRFKGDTIDRFLSEYEQVLTQMVDAPEQRVSKLHLQNLNDLADMDELF